MPLIAQCDVCKREASVVWLPSGRLVRPDGWWIMPGVPVVIACCQAHVPGIGPVAPLSEEDKP